MSPTEREAGGGRSLTEDFSAAAMQGPVLLQVRRAEGAIGKTITMADPSAAEAIATTANTISSSRTWS